MVTGDVELAIGIDFIGLGDRHDKNLGYVIRNSDSLFIAARIDYDHAFFFDANKSPRDPKELFLVKPRSRKYFAETIINYGLEPCRKALELIAAVPDKQLEATVWKSLNEYLAINSGEDSEIKKYIDLTAALLERKTMVSELIQHMCILEGFINGSSLPKDKLESSIDYIFGDKNGLMAYAASTGNKTLARHLSKKYGHTFEYVTNYGTTPLHVAVDHQGSDFLNFMLRKKIDFNVKDRKMRTPLYYVARSGNVKACKTLLANKARIEEQDYLGLTALHTAVANGHTEIVNMLLDNQANPNALDNNKKTPLFYGINDQQVQIVQSLLNHGADIHASDKEGRTALHTAVIKNQYKIFQLLVHNGANINAVDNNGHNAFHYATENRFLNCIKLPENAEGLPKGG